MVLFEGLIKFCVHDQVLRTRVVCGHHTFMHVTGFWLEDGELQAEKAWYLNAASVAREPILRSRWCVS